LAVENNFFSCAFAFAKVQSPEHSKNMIGVAHREIMYVLSYRWYAHEGLDFGKRGQSTVMNYS